MDFRSFDFLVRILSHFTFLEMKQLCKSAIPLVFVADAQKKCGCEKQKSVGSVVPCGRQQFNDRRGQAPTLPKLPDFAQKEEQRVIRKRWLVMGLIGYLMLVVIYAFIASWHNIVPTRPLHLHSATWQEIGMIRGIVDLDADGNDELLVKDKTRIKRGDGGGCSGAKKHKSENLYLSQQKQNFSGFKKFGNTSVLKCLSS